MRGWQTGCFALCYSAPCGSSLACKETFIDSHTRVLAFLVLNCLVKVHIELVTAID